MRGALGPHLDVFLVRQQHWSRSEAGIVTTAGVALGTLWAFMPETCKAQ